MIINDLVEKGTLREGIVFDIDMEWLQYGCIPDAHRIGGECILTVIPIVIVDMIGMLPRHGTISVGYFSLPRYFRYSFRQSGTGPHIGGWW